MSGIVPAALRIAAVQALKGRTLAGARVADSALGAVDVQALASPAPFVIVMTEDQKVETAGRDLLNGTRIVELVIEAALAGPVTVEGEGEPDIVIPHTDENMELILDVIGRQIVRALLDQTTAWSRVFMRLVPQIATIEVRRGGSAEKGARFAAHQMVLTCETISEPTFAAPADGGPLADFFAAAASVPALAAVATVMQAALAGADLTDWERVRAEIGMTEGEAIGIGLEPFPVEGPDAPAPITEIIVERETQ